jgi:HK97 family phage major capsid protein
MASMRTASEVEHALKRAGDVKSMNHHLSSVYAASGKNSAPPVVDDATYTAYQKAFASWVRSGKDHMVADELKAMHTGSDPSGGYLVTPDTSGVVVSRLYETSDMRSIASIQTIGTDALEGRTDLDEADAGWVGEQQARPATGTPDLGKWRIPVHEMYAMPEATVKLLEDSSIDVAAWLANKVADKFARIENTAFVLGNTINKPRGFLSYTTAATADSARAWGVLEHIATGTSGGFGTAPNGTEKFVDLVHKLKAKYRRNAKFVFNRTTLAAIRKLKDADGNFMWLPSMTEDTPNRLMGYGYREFEDMPDIAANTLSIGFGDFKAGYQIVDRLGIRVIRDELTNKPFVRFYTVRRVGGDVIDFEAIKFLKFATS